MMTQLAPYAVPAVCSGAIFAWEKWSIRQNCQIQKKSRQMNDVIIHVVTRCLGVFQAGYLATSAPMAAVLVVAPCLGSNAALPVSAFALKKFGIRSPELVKSKMLTIITLCGMSLATSASYAVYAPSMHWGKQAVVIAIHSLVVTAFYYLYRHSLGGHENQVVQKVHPWLTLVEFPVRIGSMVVAKNYMLRVLIWVHLRILIEQVAIRCFASSPQTTQPRHP